jgi:ubiquinone/menaquinone biosynthesis C-methylase UbiE
MLKITELNKKTRKILGKIHEGRIKYKKGYSRVTNYLKLNNKKKNFFKNKICGDFGCGNHAGNSKRMLIEGAKFVHLVDLSNKIKPEIKKSLKGFEKKYKFTKGTVEKLTFKSNYFDIVNCSGVIHHTNNDLKAYKEIFRVLKKNSTAFIVVHGEGGLLTKFTMDIARKEYLKNKLIKKIFDELMYGKLKKYLPFFKKNLNKSNYKKIETLFQIISDNDLRLTIQDRILSPKYKLFNYKKLKKYLLSIGFKSVTRTPIKPYFGNIRDLLSPLYGNPDHILSKFLYGDGMLRFVAKK